MKIAFCGHARVRPRRPGGASPRPASTIVLVLTQPDRPAGRGMKLQASPVKQFAVGNGWPVAQPRSLRLDGKYPDEAAGRARRHRWPPGPT